ncbi:alpha/beta hydrolase family protein [Ulvibacter antarcticus]|uniref:AB hydrolase-1 domain-containing protein n=1 Tax=Ulvibacter antarcticus TaxID=442714 RepID=A0A3L9Z743_9FLAO|nr:alpha/beta fold hydrolase [Ulvibacter antarcticus]RMA66085.1 hypothetical protein BXY75_0504 [Ulvibacter antarcticus]
MIIRKNEVLSAEGKKPIVYDVYYNASKLIKPIVIFCHGYKGFKDWGAWNLVAETFADAGFFFLKFNFSHNGGTIEQPIDFPDLEAFAKNNFSLEMDDLDRVLNFLTSETSYQTETDVSNINLIAHSRGGGIVLIKAVEDERISKVVTWAGVSDFKARFQEGSPAFNAWQETGITHVENGRTKQQMPHNIQFYNDFKVNEDRFTIKQALQKLKKPHLILQGSEDPNVVLKEAQAMHDWNPKSRLEIIEGGDHVFGASHPWESKTLPSDLKKATDLTIEFLKSTVAYQ